MHWGQHPGVLQKDWPETSLPLTCCPLLGSLALGLEAFEAASWNCPKGPESTASSRRALCYVSPCVSPAEKSTALMTTKPYQLNQHLQLSAEGRTEVSVFGFFLRRKDLLGKLFSPEWRWERMLSFWKAFKLQFANKESELIKNNH